MVDFGGECFPEGSDGIDVSLGDFVVWHFNFGVKEFEFPELVDGVVDRVSGIAAVVRVSKSGLGPGLSFKVSGGEGIKVIHRNLRKKSPGVIGILVVE